MCIEARKKCEGNADQKERESKLIFSCQKKTKKQKHESNETQSSGSASSRKIRPRDLSIETRFIGIQPKEQFEQFDSDDELAAYGLSIVDGQILQQNLSDVAISDAKQHPRSQGLFPTQRGGRGREKALRTRMAKQLQQIQRM